MHKQSKIVLVVSILASLVAFLDSSVVNVALPAVTDDLGGGLAAQQWIVSAYLLTLGACILIAGSLSDTFGRKRVMSVGLVGFMAASVLCAIAPSTEFLIIMRALQGLAGALLVPSSLALIISVFSGEEQGKAIGTWTAWTGIAFIIGPLLGGFLIDFSSWRWVFGINVLPIAITLIMLKRLDLREKLPKNAQVDFIGALLCVIGLGAIVYSFIQQPIYGWSSPHIVFSLLTGMLGIAGFLLYESKAKYPMLPFKLFKVRNFSAGNIATFAIYGGFSIATFIIVIFVQSIGSYTAFEAGMTLLPVTILMFLLSPRFGALSAKYGPRLFMALGPIVCSVGFLSLLRVNTPINYWAQIFPGIIIFGVGLAMTVAPLTSAILSGIDSENAGIGSAINNAVARIAGLISVSLVGLIIGAEAFSQSADNGVAAFHKGVITMTLMLFAGGIISAVGIQNKKVKQTTKA